MFPYDHKADLGHGNSRRNTEHLSALFYKHAWKNITQKFSAQNSKNAALFTSKIIEHTLKLLKLLEQTGCLDWYFYMFRTVFDHLDPEIAHIASYHL